MYTTLLGFALLAAVPPPPTMPPTFRVNCDVGQSLTTALKRAEFFPGATILIRGTCRGNFVVKTNELRLIGLTPQQSSLAPSADGLQAPLLHVRDARNVYIRGLGFHDGYVGIQFERSPGGTVVDSEVWNNEAGAYYRNSIDGYVLNSSFHDNEAGLTADTYSNVTVTGSELRDNRYAGAGVFRYSSLSLIDSEVTGNGFLGAGAYVHSWLSLWNATFTDNGEVHVLARERSDLLITAATLGPATDATPFSLSLQGDSSLYSYSNTQFTGDVSVAASHLELGAVRVDGAIWAREFAHVLLYSSEVTQSVNCNTAADLVCGSSTLVATFGCPSAPGSCTAPSPMPPRPAGAAPLLLDPRRSGPDAPWMDRLRSLGGADRD